MALRESPPVRADHVGSLLRPQALFDARAKRAGGAIDDAALREAEDAAIRDVVAMQHDVGLKSATDGEFRRASWHMDFIYALDGVSKVEGDITVKFHNEQGDCLVTTKKPRLEAKDDLKRRIEEASRYVDIERLCLSPQCGFSSTVEGNVMTYDDEVAKLELIIETANEAWGS